MLTPEDTQDFDASDHSHCLKIRLRWIWCCHCTRAKQYVRLTEISLETYSFKPGDHVSMGMVQWSNIPLLPVCCWCHHLSCLSYENIWKLLLFLIQRHPAASALNSGKRSSKKNTKYLRPPANSCLKEIYSNMNTPPRRTLDGTIHSRPTTAFLLRSMCNFNRH